MQMLSVHPSFLLAMPGGTEMLLILLIVILLFGAKRIPDLAKGLGRGIHDFKDAKDGTLKED